MPLRYAALALACVLAAPAAAQPDLTITSAESEDPTAEAGDRVSLEYEVANLGSSESPETSIGFYVSTDQAFSSDDAFAEREDVDDLDAGDTEDDDEQISLPDNLADGDYFILVVADDRDRVSETDETNNAFAIPITISGGGDGGQGGADLRVTSVTADASSGAPGAEVEVEYDIANGGSESTGEFRVAVYLSRDAVRSGDDVLLSREDADGVDAGDSGDEDAELEIPDSAEPGDYFILVVADDRGQVSETDESNNVGTAPFRVTGSGGTSTGDGDADLRVTALSVSPTTADAGAEIELAYTVANAGSADAGESRIGFYVSADRALSSDDVLLAREDLDGVDAGDSEDGDEDELRLPTSLDAGDYFVLAVADDRSRVAESRETNNTAATPITITGGGTGGDGRADLRVRNVSLTPGDPEVGRNVTVDFSLANDGDGQAGRSTFAAYLSTDRTLSSSDTRLGQGNVAGVASESALSRRQAFRIRDNTAPGEYFLILVADDLGTIRETDEANNARATALTVLAPVAAEGSAARALALTAAPNPAAGAAAVRWSVPAAGDVRVTVVDALGRRVAVLADGPHAAGDYAAEWAAPAPGLYVVRAEAGGDLVSHRLTVVR